MIPRFRPLALSWGLVLGAVGVLAGSLIAQQFPDPPPRPNESTPPTNLFFPAIVPVLGANVPERQLHSTVNGQRMTAPIELSDYVYEFFYPALGSRLNDHTLSKKQEAALTSYHTLRQALLSEVYDRLEETKNSEPADREKSLRALAVVQAKRLAEWDAAAEALRLDLLASGFARDPVNWFDLRQWQLGDPSIRAGLLERSAVYQVARATAFYQAGVSAESRGLIAELADDLRTEARALRNPRVNHGVALSPALARVTWPADGNAEIRRKLDAYTAERNALKDAWLDLIRRTEEGSLTSRQRRYHTLSDEQASAQAELERKADDIRRDLATMHKTVPPLPPQLPPELSKRIEAYRLEKSALNRELVEKMISLESVPQAFSSAGRGNPEGRITEIALQMRAAAAARAERRKIAEETFRLKHRDRYDALEANQAAIHTQLEDFARTTTDPTTGEHYNPVELMNQITSAQIKLDQWSREETIYRDYQTAMLEPGLSAPQRRLLFGAAVISLSQDLPDGEVTNARFMLRL